MNKLFINLVLIVSLVILSNTALAIDCPASTVRHLQVENHAVLVYLEGQNWHLVGLYDQGGTREKLSALLAAQVSGKKVIIRYPDGYNCAAYEISTPSSVVRTLI